MGFCKLSVESCYSINKLGIWLFVNSGATLWRRTPVIISGVNGLYFVGDGTPVKFVGDRTPVMFINYYSQGN